MTPDALTRMRALWEGSPELSAKVIGERFGVSKNVVVGRADRGGWASRPRGNQNTRTASQASRQAVSPSPEPRVPRRDRDKAPADYVPRTLFGRLDALDRMMTDVLRKTAVVVEAERAAMRAASLAAAERKAGAAA